MKEYSIARTVLTTWAAMLLLQITPSADLLASRTPSLPLVAVMPIEIRGLSPDETDLLRAQFLRSLRSTGRFAIMHDDTMWTILKEANFGSLEGCAYSHCIADVGKVLGVQHVFHLTVARRGKLYTVRIRVINSPNAEILHDATREHSGEFEPVVSTVLPEMTAEVLAAKLESWEQYKWYIVGGAVLVLATTIYFINKSLERSANSDLPGQPNPGPID